MNADLIKPFIREEIKKSLFAMHPTKALSKDDILAMFYQIYWHIVGESVTNACLKFLNKHKDFYEFNHTLLASIPKFKEPKNVGDYCPISLCSLLYEIIAKAVANRLKTCLS